MPISLQEFDAVSAQALGQVTPTRSEGMALRPRAVVVHGGARDSYQLALALEEADLLETLVTDFFWSEETAAGKFFKALLPTWLVKKFRLRSAPGLPSRRVSLCLGAGLGIGLLDHAPLLPFAFRRWLIRNADSQLGRAAGRWAKRSDAFLVSYSYVGYAAFSTLGRPSLLFQMHPHPATMRRLLRAEMDRRPESASSLQLEWELSLPEEDFNHLAAETQMASRFIVASSFTRESLIEHGANAKDITVIPYGVDLRRFHPGVDEDKVSGPKLRLLFVGRINQRKGLSYLLDALRILASERAHGADDVHLTVCGRVLDSLAEFGGFNGQLTILSSVDNEDLLAAYQQADLFVLPSIAEGFGQVLLEALACGLPILSTTRTAARDLIDEGVHGFVVEPQRADLLADRIAWAIEHRGELAAMGVEARRRAELFTWQRFRHQVAATVADFMDDASVPTKGEPR